MNIGLFYILGGVYLVLAEAFFRPGKALSLCGVRQLEIICGANAPQCLSADAVVISDLCVIRADRHLPEPERGEKYLDLKRDALSVFFGAALHSHCAQGIKAARKKNTETVCSVSVPLFWTVANPLSADPAHLVTVIHISCMYSN